MIYTVHPLPAELDKYIETIFHYKDFVPDHSIERVIPTGHVFLLFEFDGFIRHTYDDDQQSTGTFSKVWVSGMHDRYINISAHKNSEMLVVQFKTMGTLPFFHIPAAEYTNKVSDANSIFDESIMNLHKALLSTANESKKFALLESWLLSRLDEKLSTPEDLTAVLYEMTEKPFARHSEVLAGYPKTQKHLISQFKKYAGLTPKALHRIFRFNKLLQTIHTEKKIVWTDIVYETGYSDQAHFIKDFTGFCGFNPTKYISNGFNDSVPNFFPLDPEG